jgi:hypothetical protein
MEPICGEIEYTFLGIAMSSKSLAVDESKEVKQARSRRRTRAVAKRLVSGVFKFPACCRPSTLEDEEDYTEEYSRHIPYAPRKVPESMNQLVAYKPASSPCPAKGARTSQQPAAAQGNPIHSLETNSPNP